MMHRLYRATTHLAGPAIRWYLHHRLQRGKEHQTRFTERHGQPSLPRPTGPLVWLHGASVGEAQSLLPLIERIAADYPVSLLLTTGTVTSAQLLGSRLPPQARHQFVPVDRPSWVQSFLDHWQPQLAVWSESDFWPNLLDQTHQRQIPMVLVQGRVSPKSFRQWQRVPSFIGRILSHFDLCLAQSPTDAQRLTQLGGHGVNYVGNLKLAVDPLPVDEDQLAILRQAIGNRPIWVAASTHAGEEIIAAQTHQSLKVAFPDLLTIIIPRHPNRAAAILAEITALGLSATSRSQQQMPEGDLYLADTMGEMGLFYRLSNIVFMGKSLCGDGGQNPFEAARLESAILFGPNMSNFPDMSQSLLQAGGATQVADPAELQARLHHLLSDAVACRQQALAAKQWAKSEDGILDRFMVSLAPFLERLHAHT